MSISNKVFFSDLDNPLECMKLKIKMLIDALCEVSDEYNKFDLDTEEIENYYYKYHLNDAVKLFTERIAAGWLDEHLDVFIADDCIFVCGLEETLNLFKNKKQLLHSNDKSLSESIKKQIAGKQRFKCSNKPGSSLKYLNDYLCPLWRNGGDGSFDEAGYEIDHIIEKSIGGNNDESNLQALCQSCHKLKTKRFLNDKSI